MNLKEKYFATNAQMKFEIATNARMKNTHTHFHQQYNS